MRRKREEAEKPAAATPEPWLLLVEDDDLVARAFARIIRRYLPVRIAGTRAAAQELICETGLAGAIVDINLPDGNGLDVVEALVHARPDVPVVVCSEERDMEFVDRATRLGAAFLSKGEPTTAVARFAREVRSVGAPNATQPTPLAARVSTFAERHELSEKQLPVLRLAVRRLSYEQIARELGVTKDTVEFHARGIHAKTAMLLADCVREILAEAAPDAG